MQESTEKGKKKYFRWEVLIPLLVLLTLASSDLHNKSSFKVVIDGESMSPTYQDKEIVSATSLYSQIVKKDVIVFEHDGETVVKRVIYTPGDTFWVMNDDDMYWEPLPSDTVKDFTFLNLWPMKKIVVPPNSYWVEGDNRLRSLDSRVYGLINIDDIKGIVAPWRDNGITTTQTAPLKRLYHLREQGEEIKRGNFIINEKLFGRPNL